MKTLVLSFGLLTSAFSLAGAGALMTQDKALRIAFPEGAPERRTLYVSDAEASIIRKAAKAPFDARVVTYYAGPLADRSTGYAFFETHVIRTMPETFMTVIDSSGTVRFVELLAFYEPEDYKPSSRWLDQFKGRPMSDDLELKRGIRNITGATLTARAINDGVRRALAVWARVTGQEAAGMAKP